MNKVCYLLTISNLIVQFLIQHFVLLYITFVSKILFTVKNVRFDNCFVFTKETKVVSIKSTINRDLFPEKSNWT